MESTGDTCLPITLSLGEIEISLDEARRLRPGMCLEFERPQCFEGMLLLAGAPWARARVRVDERVVTLEVLGPVETDTRQKAGSQETSG